MDNSSQPTGSSLFENKNERELAIYKKEAQSVITFKFLYDEDGFNTKIGQFKPEMAHQVFGENESIFGYKSLEINLYYLHNSVKCYLDVQCSGKIESSKLEADDITSTLDEWLPEAYVTDKVSFLKAMEHETHDKIYGKILHEFTDKNEVASFPNEKDIHPKYKISLVDVKDDQFIEFHKRFQTLIIWFIDAANFIDLGDERWMIFYIYEEFEHPKTKQIMISPVGFCTIYKFYAYPDKIRPRISQFFILPTHQRRGLGTKLYENVINYLREQPDVVDITVEEPTATFQKIRDIVDCQYIYKNLDSHKFETEIQNQKKFNEYMRKNKLCKRQCQRIFDVLGCYKAKKCGPLKYNAFVETIKNRITNEIEREARAGKRFCQIPGFTPEPTDTKSLVDSEYNNYLEDISPSVKYLVAHM